jgi:hypothetical protein
MVFGLEDDDRRRLVAVARDRHLRDAPPSKAVLALLERVFALPAAEQRRFFKLVRAYVNRWGQIPQLPSWQHSKATTSRRLPPPDPASP